MLYGTNPTAVWLYNGSTYVDNTIDAQVAEARDFPIMSDGDDYLYIGFERRFDALIFWVKDFGEYGNVKWEFSAANNEWKEFVPVQPRPYEFYAHVDYVRWSLDYPLFDQWVSTPLTSPSPDDTARFWIRVGVGTSNLTCNLYAVTVRSYTSLVGPDEVQAQLQLETPFDEDSSPSFNDMERYIRGAEDGLFHITGHYYRPEFVEDELVNFKAYGMTLRNRPILDIINISVHTGSYWETKEMGRSSDYHIEPYTGHIYISTLFMDVVPPILRRGYSERRNQGAFKAGVRARYIYGHDSRQDRFSVEIGRIVTKQAAMDTVVNRDFNRLIPQGLDRVQLSQKIDIWKEEIREFKERYAKLVMF